MIPPARRRRGTESCEFEWCLFVRERYVALSVGIARAASVVGGERRAQHARGGGVTRRASVACVSRYEEFFWWGRLAGHRL